MALEIEKKYRLARDEWEALRGRLRDAGAAFAGDDFEENTLYTGGMLGAISGAVLRLRRVNGRAVLTYKERLPTTEAIKRQREEETEVADAEVMAAILEALGYRPALVYEKRRATWHLDAAEIVLDELPFGWFVEIEGAEAAIIAAEKILQLDKAAAEHATYPGLTAQHGARQGELVAARFVE